MKQAIELNVNGEPHAALVDDAGLASIDLWCDTIARHLQSGPETHLRIEPAAGEPFDVTGGEAPSTGPPSGDPDTTLAGTASAVALFLSGRAGLDTLDVGGDRAAAESFAAHLVIN